MKTSIDVVSEDDSDRFFKIIAPALKQVDYCILNEVEASKVTGVKVREDGKLLEDGIAQACEKLFELGVSELVAIHFPEGSYALRANGEKLDAGIPRCPRDISKERQGPEMHSVPEYFLVCMRTGPWKNA